MFNNFIKLKMVSEQKQYEGSQSSRIRTSAVEDLLLWTAYISSVSLGKGHFLGNGARQSSVEHLMCPRSKGARRGTASARTFLRTQIQTFQEVIWVNIYCAIGCYYLHTLIHTFTFGYWWRCYTVHSKKFSPSCTPWTSPVQSRNNSPCGTQSWLHKTPISYIQTICVVDISSSLGAPYDQPSLTMIVAYHWFLTIDITEAYLQVDYESSIANQQFSINHDCLSSLWMI